MKKPTVYMVIAEIITRNVMSISIAIFQPPVLKSENITLCICKQFEWCQEMRNVDSRLERLSAINLEIRDIRNLILCGEDDDECLRSLDSSDLIFSGAVLASESVENIGDFLGGDLSESLSVVQHIIDELLIAVGDSHRLEDDALRAYLSEEAAKKATRVAIDSGHICSSESFASSEFDFLFSKI